MNLIHKITSVLSFRIGGNYRKHLVVFLLLASLPGIIFGFILYFVSKSQMEKELQQIHQNHLYKTIDSIKEQFSDLEVLLANWASDERLSGKYSYVDVVHDYKEVRSIFNRLLTMEGYHPLIGQVELYINNPEKLIFTKNKYTELGKKPDKEKYEQLLTKNQSLFWDYSLPSVEEQPKNNIPALVHNLRGNTTHTYGSLIIFLKREKLFDLISSPYEDGSVFIVRDNNNWMFDNKEQQEPTTLQQAIMKEIATHSNQAEPFMYQVGEENYTVTYDYFSRLGEKWYYVSIAPMSNITAPVVFMSKLFVIFSLVILLTAIILALFASKKLYAPVKKLANIITGDKHLPTKNEFELIETEWNHLSSESVELQKRLQDQLPHLREGLLLQLIQGYLYAYREEDLHERMQQFGWQSKDKKYVVLFIQLLGFSKLRGKFSEDDEGLVTFLAVNIAEELIQSVKLEANVVNFHNLSLGVLISFPKDHSGEEIDTAINHISEEMISCINDICQLNVSIGISRVSEALNLVPIIFEETKRALSFRSLTETNQIIDMKMMNEQLQNLDGFEYPFDIEKALFQSIKQKNIEESLQLLAMFFDSIAKKNVSEAMLKQSALKLFGGIFHIILQADLIESFVKKGAIFYDELYNLKDVEEIRLWFQDKIILPIIEQLSQKQEYRLRLTVEKVIHLLEENYMDDISLDYCADQVNLNPTILSKVFKEISGSNFIDYLTNIRLNKAKELLLETDAKIKNIAESIGYKHSYFNRIFKKNEGITPSEFREMNRKKVV